MYVVFLYACCRSFSVLFLGICVVFDMYVVLDYVQVICLTHCFLSLDMFLHLFLFILFANIRIKLLGVVVLPVLIVSSHCWS